MSKIRLGLVGCGGMGTRRIYGLAELTGTPFCNVELAALCDISKDHAELAADEAEKLLGARPQVFTDLEAMARQVADLGLHVMVEKPMAITVKACHQMIEAARRNGRKTVRRRELPPDWCAICSTRVPSIDLTWRRITPWVGTGRSSSPPGAT